MLNPNYQFRKMSAKRYYLKGVSFTYEFHIGPDFFRAKMNWESGSQNNHEWIIFKNEKKVGNVLYSNTRLPGPTDGRDAIYMCYFNQGIDLEDYYGKNGAVPELEILKEDDRITFIGNSNDPRYNQSGKIEIVRPGEYFIKWDNPYGSNGAKLLRWVKARYIRKEFKIDIDV